MAKRRVSVKDAEVRLALERSFERKVRDFAFEHKMQLEAHGSEVFLQKDGRSELLCAVEDDRHFWRTVWRAMCEEFPALARYLN